MYSWNSMKKVTTLAREQISTAPDGAVSQIYTFLTFVHTFIFFSTGNYMLTNSYGLVVWLQVAQAFFRNSVW